MDNEFSDSLNSDVFTKTITKISEKNEGKLLGILTEKDKFRGSLLILLGLLLTTWLGFIIYACNPQQGSVILEICKTCIPPLATLIIAFYWKDSKK